MPFEHHSQPLMTVNGFFASRLNLCWLRTWHRDGFPRVGHLGLPLLRGAGLAGCGPERLDDPLGHGSGGPG